jgi:PKD repeat protein
VNVQTTPVGRFPYSSEGNVQGLMLGVGVGANSTSSALGATNINNNTLVVLEPINFDPNYLLTTYIGDTYQGLGSAWGDFGGLVFAFTVENTTPSPFTSATVSDFYMNVPAGTGKKQFIDPFTGSTTGNADYLGYFTLNPNGSMTFTRAAAATAPSVGTVTATLTNGFAPLTAVFTNTATGTITNWVWNFGNGTIITNTTGGNVTNTYAASGNYTVTLTVYGPLGSSTSTQTSYIVASPAPKLGILPLNAGKLTLSGSNGPVGVQYRVLMATNLTQALATWTPVLTNTISSSGIYGYTNSWPTNKAAFYRLVSP